MVGAVSDGFERGMITRGGGVDTRSVQRGSSSIYVI